MTDKHDLVSALKAMALELGRTPQRDEFVRTIRGGKLAINKLFGTYSAFVHASGLEPVAAAGKKNLRIELDIESDLEQHAEKDRTPVKLKGLAGTLVCGDLHFPFVDKKALNAFFKFIEQNKKKITRVIQIGDLTDLYAWSKFPRSHNYYNAKDEMALAKKMAVDFWARIKTMLPKAQCIQILGNHDTRSVKRTVEVLPEAEHIINEYMERFFTFDGVETIHDTRQELIIDDCIFIHGYRSKIGAHTDYNLMSTVCGHLHKMGITYKQIRNKTLFEANAGYLGDPTSKALSYTPQKTVHWTHGFLYFNEYGPQCVII